MTVTIRIVGHGDAKEAKCRDGCITKTVEDDLVAAYGPGILKQDGFGVDSETLNGGDYEYYLTKKRAIVEKPGNLIPNDLCGTAEV
jgi:hypothetical protein